MTEKRFYIKCDEYNAWSVWEKDKDVVVFDLLKYDAEVVCKALNELSEENEQLKQYIYDNIDENICEVCSYQYLEKHSQMQGYYVAKCKKGYDNCSKGTVIHCKDFKFKELNVND